VSRYGVMAMADSLDHVGPLAREVADAALMYDAMAGPDPRDPTSLGAGPANAAKSLGGACAGCESVWTGLRVQRNRRGRGSRA